MSTESPRARPLTLAERRAVAAIAAATAALGLLGFTASFTRVQVAAAPSFGWWAWILPLGVDVGIAVFSGLDIVLARLDMRMRALRLIPWALVGATVYLNVSGEPTWFGRVAHAVLPGLWVVAVEVAAHVARRRAGLRSATRMDRIRRSRWILAFPSTAGLWRRMVLWEIRSYPEALQRERERVLALAALRDTYGRRWRWKAPRRMRTLYRLGEFAPDAPGVRAEFAPQKLISAPVDAPPPTISAPTTPDDRAAALPAAAGADVGALIHSDGAKVGADFRAAAAGTRHPETISAPPAVPPFSDYRADVGDTPSDLPARSAAGVGADFAPTDDGDAPSPPYRTKRTHLEALLDELPDDDDRSAYELAQVLAPQIPLDEGTARRYIATWREIRAAARTLGAKSAPVALNGADPARSGRG